MIDIIAMPLLLQAKKDTYTQAFDSGYVGAGTCSWVSLLDYWGRGSLKRIGAELHAAGAAMPAIRISIDGSTFSVGKLSTDGNSLYLPTINFYSANSTSTIAFTNLSSGDQQEVDIPFSYNLLIEGNNSLANQLQVYWQLDVE